MAVGSLTVSAADTEVSSDGWTAGKYYYLKTADNSKYLSLCGTKADSVVFTTITESTDKKAKIDSALWEITKVGVETSGEAIYQFKNKKTKSILSFAKSDEAVPVLAEGISEWSFKDGIIAAYWDEEKMILTAGADGAAITFDGSGTELSVVAPKANFPLKAAELGESFSVFRLTFGDEYEGDIFSGKDLVAKDVPDASGKTTFVTLQVKGDESFSDGKAKFLGVDTLKTDITGATGVYGAQFKADSTYTNSAIHTLGNGDFQQFKFLVDLKNDSLAMFVYRAPDVNAAPLASSSDLVRVVFAQIGDKKVLTVAERNGDNSPKKGEAPLITVAKGSPSKIDGGTGVYFLKSASKGEAAGKYISAADPSGIVTMDDAPSVNHPEGQWYIKEEGGMYSIVDRKTNTSLLLKGEVFAVQGMENTFTFGGNADSITVEPQTVDLSNKFLGSMNFTKEDMANNGYALNLIQTGAETSDSYAVVSDSILQVKTVKAEDAFVFKIEAEGEAEAVGGAKALGDTIFVMKYKLKSQFSDKYVAYDNDKKSLKLSLTETPYVFRFNTSTDGGKYSLEVTTATDSYKYITADLSSSNMILGNTPAYFKFVEMDAPEYDTLETSYRRFTSDAKSLTMNTLTLFAEMKMEGQEILKSTYEKDNFSLKLIKSDASTVERPLYFITTVMPSETTKAEAVQTRYYMVPGKDSASVAANKDKYTYEGAYRVHFITNDTIETMKDSLNNPALWALKLQESGDCLLESQQEVNDITNSVKYPYVGIVNNVVVMSAAGIEFSLAETSAPVANEAIEAPETIKVIGGSGELQIRGAGGKRVTISNILGQTVGSRFISSDNETVSAARGVLIVSVEGDKAYKVIVK